MEVARQKLVVDVNLEPSCKPRWTLAGDDHLPYRCMHGVVFPLIVLDVHCAVIVCATQIFSEKF